MKSNWRVDNLTFLRYFEKGKFKRSAKLSQEDLQKKRTLKRWILSFFALQSTLLTISLLGVGYPIMHFLFVGNAKFTDFIDGLVLSPLYFSNILANMDTFSQPQGPPVLVFYEFWRALTPDLSVLDSKLIKIYQIALILSGMCAFLFFTLRKISGNSKLALVLIASYPTLFVLGRGNPDLICVILLGLVIIFIQRSNHSTASILIGLMGAFKVPYLLFALILLPMRKLRYFVIIALSFFLFFFGSLATRPFAMSEQIKTFQIITERYFRDYAVGDGGLLFNDSLFGVMKGFSYISFGSLYSNIEELKKTNSALVSAYSVSSVLLLSVLAFWYFKKSNWVLIPKFQLLPEITFAITLILVLFPHVSAEYRLVLFLPPLAWLVSSRSALLNSKVLFLIFVLFIPKYFIHFEFSGGVRGQFGFGTLLNPLIMMGLLIYTLKHVAVANSASRNQRSQKS